jgi:hypothetical protein
VLVLFMCFEYFLFFLAPVYSLSIHSALMLFSRKYVQIRMNCIENRHMWSFQIHWREGVFARSEPMGLVYPHGAETSKHNQI